MMQACEPHRPDEDMPLDNALIYCQEEPLRHGVGAWRSRQNDPTRDRATHHAQQFYPQSTADSVASNSSKINSSSALSSSLTTACSTVPSSLYLSCSTASSSTTSSPSAVDLELIRLGMRADWTDDGSDSDGFMASAAPPYELDREMMGMLATNWNLNEQQQQQQQQQQQGLQSARSAAAPWDVEPMFSPESALSMPQDPGAAAAMGLHAVMSDVAMLNMLGMSFPGESVPLPMNQRPQLPTSATPASIMTPDAFGLPFQDVPVTDFPFPLQPGDVYGGQTSQTSTPYSSAMTGVPSAFAPMAPQVGNNNSSQQQLGPPLLYQASVPLKMEPTKLDAMDSTRLVSPIEALEGNQASHDAARAYAIKRHLYADPASSNSSTTSSSGRSTVTSSPSEVTQASPGAFIPGPTPAGRQQSAEKRGKPKRIRRLCSVPGCGKRARSQDLCIAHGGGRRCIVEGCEKSSQGGNLCIKHGGGKRCRFPGCDKAAQTNSLCKAHGGGPRCQFAGCTKSSQGGGFCRAHGGGKRCAAEGCNKGTQRGDFCALHGGSRYCEVEGCTRNDRGGGFCAHHGGGKRCSVAGCNRSCRRNGMCSTHLRLMGREDDGTELEAQF